MAPGRGSRIGFHVFTVVAILICLLAARWQWQRAHRTDGEAVPVVPAVAWSAFDPQSSFSGQRVSLTGKFVPGQVLVAPRERDGRPGAWVYTPFLPESPAADGTQRAAVGVLRGWVPQGATAAELAPPEGTVTVTGILVADERRATSAATGSPPSMSRIDSGALANTAGLPVRAGWLALTDLEPVAAGQPIPLEVGELPGADVGLNWRNAAYAVQWVVFAGFAGFFWNRFRRDYFVTSDQPADRSEQEASR